MGSRAFFTKSALSDLAAGLAILRDMGRQEGKKSTRKESQPTEALTAD